MEIEITTAEVLEALAAAKSLSDSKPPMRISFALAKNIRKLNDAFGDIGEVSKSLFEKYAVPGDSGEPELRPGTPERKKYDEEWNQFLKEKHIVDVHKVPMSVIQKATVDGKMEPLSISEQSALYFMFIEDIALDDWD